MKRLVLALLLSPAAPRAAQLCPIYAVTEHPTTYVWTLSLAHTLPAESASCVLLVEAEATAARLYRAAGLDPSSYGFYLLHEANASPDASFHLVRDAVAVNQALLLRSETAGPELMAGALAHEIGHAVQKVREQRHGSVPGAQYEGEADAIAADLLERAELGGAATLRRMFELLFGCTDLLASARRTFVDSHPIPAHRWAGADAMRQTQRNIADAPPPVREALEADPAGTARGILVPGSPRVIDPTVDLDEMTRGGVPQPDVALERDLVVPGQRMPRPARRWLDHAVQEARRLRDARYAGERIALSCFGGPPGP